MTIPQIGGMYEGDASRKRMLIEHGFRLPSAQDNRPLRFDEFLERVGQMVFLSATPGPWELQQAQGEFVEQVIRPTGLVDPEVVVKPTKGQIDDLMHEIRLRTERDERVLVTTLTKKMSEDLTDYLLEHGIRVRYLHSEVDTLRRVELLRELRKGDYDVLVGINLLREGLDLPEVSLVAILDADKEGFLRSGTLADPDHRPRRPQRLRRGPHVRRQDHPVDGRRRSTRPTGAGPSRSPTTRPTASTRSRCARRSTTSSTTSTARPRTPRARWPGTGRAARSSAARAGRCRAARRRCRGPARSATSGSRRDGRRSEGMARAELAKLIEELTDQMLAAARELQFELAARIRDEITELKKELRQMSEAALTIAVKTKLPGAGGGNAEQLGPRCATWWAGLPGRSCVQPRRRGSCRRCRGRGR